MDYGDSKDLPRRTTADKKLHDKVFDIAKYPKYDGYQHRLASMVYKYFDEKSFFSGFKSEIMPNKELPVELHDPIIKKFEKRKVYSSFKDNILVMI